MSATPNSAELGSLSDSGALFAGQIASILMRLRIKTPAGFNPDELKNDIEAAYDFRLGYGQDASKSSRTKAREYADRVSKAVGKLVELLDDPSPGSLRARSSLASSLKMDGVLLPNLRDNLACLLHRAEIEARSEASMRDVIHLNPNEYFVCQLARIFEQHFEFPANRDRAADGSLFSPFMEFATAVVAALDIPIVDETISKTLTKCRHADI